MNFAQRQRLSPRAALLAALVCSIFFVAGGLQPAASAPAALRDKKQNPPKLDLRVAQEGWGEAQPADVEAVLRSAARELLINFPGEQIEPIQVSRDAAGPITLFKRSKDGAIVIHLNTGDLFWAQYAYQFGHELCHVLCNYREGDAENQWLEESICEMSSLFVLRQMGERWKTQPPYESWKDFAPHLTEYAQQRMTDAALPKDMPLAKWFEKNRDALRKSRGGDRALNTTIATSLLPLIEATPEQWPAVRHLNDARPKEPETFEQFIQRWHDHTPAEHQPLIEKIGRELGVKLKVTSAGSSSSPCRQRVYS